MPESQTDVSLHFDLTCQLAHDYANAWIKKYGKMPSATAVDDIERSLGMWILLEQKRRQTLAAIKSAEVELPKRDRASATHVIPRQGLIQ